jgi:hypothetical protein
VRSLHKRKRADGKQPSHSGSFRLQKWRDRRARLLRAIVAPIVASKHGTNVLLGTPFWGTNIALYPIIDALYARLPGLRPMSSAAPPLFHIL